jgi:hypothetical protein
MIKAGRENHPKSGHMMVSHQKMVLFSDNLFYPVTDKSTQDEDNEKEKYLDEDAGRPQRPGGNTHAPGDKVPGSEHEDDTEDKAGNDTIFKETIIVFLSLVEKAQSNT